MEEFEILATELEMVELDESSLHIQVVKGDLVEHTLVVVVGVTTLLVTLVLYKHIQHKELN